jgi:hypothetical protein
MNLRRQAHETMTNVTDASKKVVESSNWATVALIGVAAVSLLALGVAVIALTRHDGKKATNGE